MRRHDSWCHTLWHTFTSHLRPVLNAVRPVATTGHCFDHVPAFRYRICSIFESKVASEREIERERATKKRRLRKVLQLCFQTEFVRPLCGSFYSIPLSDNSARIHVSYFAILLLLLHLLRLELVSFYPVY